MTQVDEHDADLALADAQPVLEQDAAEDGEEDEAGRDPVEAHGEPAVQVDVAGDGARVVVGVGVELLVELVVDVGGADGEDAGQGAVDVDVDGRAVRGVDALETLSSLSSLSLQNLKSKRLSIASQRRVLRAYLLVT